MKIAAFLFIAFIFFACGAVKKSPLVLADQRHPYCCGKVVEHELNYYTVMYDISDTVNHFFLPLFGDSSLVADSRDSIHSIRTYFQKIEYPKIWKEIGNQGHCFYGLNVDDKGTIQSIEPIRTISENDPILPQLERYFLGLRFLQGNYFGREYILHIQLRID
jgi:hypothetical protein